MLLSRSPGQIPGLLKYRSTGPDYTFARVKLALVPSVVASVVEVFEPFKSANSFGVTMICWDATLLEGVLTHLWDGGFTLLSS